MVSRVRLNFMRPQMTIRQSARSPWVRCLGVLLFVFGLRGSAVMVGLQPQEKPNNIERLALNHEIESELAAAQERLYEIQLVKGQNLQLTIASQSLRLTVLLLTPTGKTVAEDASLTAPSHCIVAIAVPETASYLVKILAHPKPNLTGTYALQANLLVSVTDEFSKRAQAQRLKVELDRLFTEQRNKEAFRQMPEVGEEAARLFGQLGMLRMQADSLNLVAEAWRLMSEWTKAIDAFTRARELCGKMLSRQRG